MNISTVGSPTLTIDGVVQQGIVASVDINITPVNDRGSIVTGVNTVANITLDESVQDIFEVTLPVVCGSQADFTLNSKRSSFTFTISKPLGSGRVEQIIAVTAVIKQSANFNASIQASTERAIVNYSIQFAGRREIV